MLGGAARGGLDDGLGVQHEPVLVERRADALDPFQAGLMRAWPRLVPP